MRTLASQSLILISALLCLSQLTTSQSSSKEDVATWKPAVYRGLTMGEATKADMVRVLGKPDSSAKDLHEPSPVDTLFYYEKKSEFGTLIEVTIDPYTSRVVGVHFSVGSASNKELEAKFGPLEKVYYSLDTCDDTGKEMTEECCYVPMYEDKAGNLLFYLSRSKGISIYSGGPQRTISFDAEAPGPKQSRCAR